VSPFNAKVVRASAGSIFRVPVIRGKLDAVSSQLRAREIRLVATSSHKGTPLGEARLTGLLAIFIGNEGSGLRRDLTTRMDEVVVIPHTPQVESLNAGVATSILLYEAARQRK
jgi:TrmH family RNA methyltransferase